MSGIRRAGIGLLVGAWLIFASLDAAAASCPLAPDVADALSNAASVFVGEATVVADQGRVATMDVISIWKGPDLPEQVEVRGTATVGSPVGPEDRRFTEGTTYLVIPENTRQPFLAGKCSATIAFNGTGLAIPAGYQEVIGAATGRAPVMPAPESEAGTGGLPMGLLAMASVVPVLAGVALIIHHRRRPSRRRLAELIPKRSDDEAVEQEQASRWHRFSIAGLGRRFFRRSGMRRIASLKRHH